MSAHPEVKPGGVEYVPCHAKDVPALKMSMSKSEILDTPCPLGHKRKLIGKCLNCIVEPGSGRPTHCPYFGDSATPARTDHH